MDTSTPQTAIFAVWVKVNHEISYEIHCSAEMADSDDDSSLREHQLKVVLVGDGTAGKTSIITRFCQNNFDKSYNQTVGVDFFLRRIILPGGRMQTEL